MRGASLRAVSELLGHQTMQMTLRYAHLSPGFLSTEINRSTGPTIGVAGKGKKRATCPAGPTAQVQNSQNC